MNDAAGGGVGSGGFDQQLGDKPLTVSSVLKEFQGLKDKFKNEDEDDCECFLVSDDLCAVVLRVVLRLTCAKPECCLCAFTSAYYDIKSINTSSYRTAYY